MTDAILEAQLLRLSDAIIGFREQDAFVVARAETPSEREAVRALLQDLVSKGKLRCSERRYYRASGGGQ